jgi:hypothetical protein
LYNSFLTTERGEREKNAEIAERRKIRKIFLYTVAGKAIGFALEQPLHVVALGVQLFEF